MDHPEHDKPSAATRRVGMADFRDDMAGHLRQVRDGASLLISWDNEVVAEARPPPEPPAPRPLRRLAGAMRGKIWMADDFDTWPEGFIEAMVDGPTFPDNDAALLGVTVHHLVTLTSLPRRHKDPFDRLPIAQAIAEDATLMSEDRWMPGYPVPVVNCSA